VRDERAARGPHGGVSDAWKFIWTILIDILKFMFITLQKVQCI
jgi:hypothetical protein